MQKLMKRMPGISGTKKALGKGKKGKKAKKGGRVTASPTGPQKAPKQPFTLPGLKSHPSTDNHGPPPSCGTTPLNKKNRSGRQAPPEASWTDAAAELPCGGGQLTDDAQRSRLRVQRTVHTQ